jgi:hypothetical protein
LNAIYLDQEKYFEYQDDENVALKVEYTADSKDLVPAADPNAFSNQEKLMKSQMVASRAMTVPGYDPIFVEKRILESMEIPDVDEVYPLVPEVGEDGQETGRMVLKFPPQPDPELEIKKADMQRRTLEGQSRAEQGMMLAGAKLAESEVNIIKTMAEAQKIADEPTLKRMELILKDVQDQRKALIELVKAEESAKTRVEARTDQ